MRGTASLSSLNELNELQELYFPKWGSRISFEGLTERSKIETLQFQASSTGFDRSIFPNLKHLILVLDEAPSATLTQQLAGMTSLEKLTIMPLGVAQSFPFQTIANQLKGLLPNAQVEETQFQLGLAPEVFRQHRQRVRQMSIEKYLK